MRKNNKGFTLIELLVVIAIVGLLASAVLVALGSARTKARDVRRASDMRQIRTALELYYDSNNAWPSPPAGCFDTCSGSWSQGLDTMLSPYISKLPIDPKNPPGPACTNFYYAFCRVSWGSEPCNGSYVLYAWFENNNNPGFKDDCNWGIYTQIVQYVP